MTWVDLFIVVVIIFYLFEGIRRGFIEQLLELIGFFITIFVAFWVYQPLSGWVERNIGIHQPFNEPIAFFIAWFILQAIYSLLMHLLYPFVPEVIRNAVTNRLAGILPAFMKAFILLAITITIATLLPIPDQLRSQISNSALGSQFVKTSSSVEYYFNKAFGRDLKNSLTVLMVPPQTEQIIEPDQRIELGFTYQNGTVDHDAEVRMFDSLNQERVKAGLNALIWNEQLAVVARAHCQDMLKKGYFGHVNLDGKNPFERMADAGITYKTAGENLAMAQSVDLAMNGLMRSPGHRANILAKDFGQIGIGAISAGRNGIMFSQEFKD